MARWVKTKGPRYLHVSWTHCPDLSGLWQGLCKTFRCILVGWPRRHSREYPGQPPLVNDHTKDAPQHVRSHEAEQLTGIRPVWSGPTKLVSNLHVCTRYVFSPKVYKQVMTHGSHGAGTTYTATPMPMPRLKLRRPLHDLD